MRHLNLTDIARLVDERPAAHEAEHLEECAACRRELESLKRQTEELAELEDPTIPTPVSMRLRDALLFEAARGRRRRLPRSLLRAAAGFLLFAGGAGFGAGMLNPASDPGEGSLASAAADESPAGTLAEAAAAVSRTEAAYLHALNRFAELSENGEGLDPVSRLAALEGIVLTTRAALREAPADPVINNYHLTAISQRDALLRQIELLSAEDTWY